MKSYKVTTCEPYTDLREKTFTDKKKMLEYVKENEAVVVKLEEVTTKDVLDKYVNPDHKDRYQVDVNVCYDDSDYCSCLDNQWNYVVFALNKKEAERLALKEAQDRLNRDNDYHKYLEVVGCRKVEFDNTGEYPRWK